MAAGKSNKEAAIGAGYEGKFISSVGSKVAKKVKVVQRIAELNGKVEQQVVNAIVRIEAVPLAHKLQRIAAGQARWLLLEEYRAARAADPSMANVPGGKTGIAARHLKTIRTAKGLTVGAEYELDEKIREIEKQIAIERGQGQRKESIDDDRPIEKIQFQWVEPAIEDKPKPVSDSSLDPMRARVQ